MDFYSLAPLHLQMLYGDYNATTSKNYMTDSDWPKYMPKSIAVAKRPDEWKLKVAPEWVKLSGKTPEKAQEMYVQYLEKNWPLFGTKIFKAKVKILILG